MSRIRTIKPEFWTSEQIISCSPFARLLFIGLLNFTDDNGIHPASVVRLKAEVFPSDGFSSEEIRSWISELTNNDLLREYVVEDKSYWVVTGWKSHQRIDKPTYKYPLPTDNGRSKTDKINQNSTSPLRVVVEDSASIRRVVDESSTTERNGREWKGEDKNICEVKTSPCSILEGELIVNNSENDASNQTVQAIFLHWKQVMRCPKAKLDQRRRNKIGAALKLGYSAEELKLAIDGCASTPFNMGDNDRKRPYNGIDLIFRDAEHIEQFLTSPLNHTSSAANSSSSPLFAGVI